MSLVYGPHQLIYCTVHSFISHIYCSTDREEYQQLRVILAVLFLIEMG